MSKLIKHSAAIQLSGSLTLAQRQCYNALLKNAFPWLERGEDHWMQTKDLEILLQKRGSRNRAWLIETAESLRDVSVRYNVLGKDRDNREIWEMNSGLLAEIGAKSNRELIKYSFPNTLNDLLREPSMYAKINLDVQARFRGHYGLPLYEFYLDILGGKRKEVEYTFWVSDLRRLLCLEKSHQEFKYLQAKVIKPAHREINTHTDIRVSVVEHLRESRSVVALKLHIERTGLAPMDAQLEQVADSAPALQRALEAYYNLDTIALVLNRYSTDYIQAQLEYLERQRGRQNIRKPGAYLRAALQADYAQYRERDRRTGVVIDGSSSKSDDKAKVHSDVEAEARKQKELEERWRKHCDHVLQQRYDECEEEERAALQVRFEHSELYQENQAMHRGRRDSGFYRRLFTTFLLQELCPEPRFHDVEAFAAWEASNQDVPPAGEEAPAT